MMLQEATPESRPAGTIREALGALLPAKRITGCLEVGTTASGQPIGIPWLAAKGAENGPCLWLVGAVHGDEINGVLAAIDFFRHLDLTQMRGSIVVVPVANPLGFDARRKRVPHDELDLDQGFPGRPDGLASEILAHRLFTELNGLADVLVSLHTMNPYFDSVPYAVYKTHPGAHASESDLLAAAACFNPFVACHMPVSGGAELPGNVAGALDYQALLGGSTAFMVELGGGSRQEPHHVASGIMGFECLAQRLGMLPGRPEATRTVRRVTQRRHVMCRHGGLFRAQASPGTIVTPGSPIGEIHDLAGQTREVVRFDQPVALIGIRSDPVVHTGDRVAFVGLEWDEIDV